MNVVISMIKTNSTNGAHLAQESSKIAIVIDF
jgi:hypothetical protein